jgi:hypothetical protein
LIEITSKIVLAWCLAHAAADTDMAKSVCVYSDAPAELA